MNLHQICIRAVVKKSFSFKCAHQFEQFESSVCGILWMWKTNIVIQYHQSKDWFHKIKSCNHKLTRASGLFQRNKFLNGAAIIMNKTSSQTQNSSFWGQNLTARWKIIKMVKIIKNACCNIKSNFWNENKSGGHDQIFEESIFVEKWKAVAHRAPSETFAKMWYCLWVWAF